MDMYKKEIKPIILSLAMFSIFSCNNKLQTKLDLDEYTIFIGSKHNEIHINSWGHFANLIERNSEIMYSFLFTSSWAIDSTIYVSYDGRRIFSHILKRKPKWSTTQTDVAKEIIGAKVNEKWYFLLGDQIIYPRDHYKYDANTPFTFEELNYLVNHRLFPKIVTKINEEYVVSKEFFAAKLGILDSSVPNGDSLFLKAIENLSTKTIPQEKLDGIRQEQLASKAPSLPKRSLWQKWFGKKKLFDSRAWKNSIKDK